MTNSTPTRMENSTCANCWDLPPATVDKGALVVGETATAVLAPKDVLDRMGDALVPKDAPDLRDAGIGPKDAPDQKGAAPGPRDDPSGVNGNQAVQNALVKTKNN